MAAAEVPKPLTEIEELEELIDSEEQQHLVISILEDKKHIREQKNFKKLIKAAVTKEREGILIWFVKNVYDKNKNGALEMAVNSGIENVIYLALEHDDVNVNEGLYFAVKANKLHVIKLLLAQGADVNYIRNGYTLLHTAIMQNCELFIVEFLINKVKDIDAVAKNKKTALEIVQELRKNYNGGAKKEYLENIQTLIMLTKQTKANIFECLQGLPDNLRGYSYQIKLLTLYAIVYTKLATSSDCEFELGTEATDQVPFDDIYIKEKRNGLTTYQFIQVKQTKSTQYNLMKESKFFTILKSEKASNVKEHLKGNDTIIKMFMAFDKISNNYLHNETNCAKFVYATTTGFENNSCCFFVPKAKDDLLRGVGGRKWQISDTYYLELEITFILLNLLASSKWLTMFEVNVQIEIEKQSNMINNLQVGDIVNQKLSDNKLWSVFEIAKLGLNAIKGYLNKLEDCRKAVSKANDQVSLKNNFPEELELPQSADNFKAYKTSCLGKISEVYKSLKTDKALWTYFSKWDDEAMFTDTMSNFILHFSIYTGCPNSEILDDIITEEICHELMVHKSDIFSSYCLQHFSKWIINFKNELGNLYTHHDGKKLFSDLAEQIFKGFIKIYDEDLQGYNLSFNNDNLELLNFLSNENNNKILHVVTEHPRLHSIKVFQTLKMFEGHSSKFNARNIVFTNSDIIFKSDETVKNFIQIISTKLKKIYIILELVNDVHECNRSFDFLNELQTTIAQNIQSKIILVGKKDNLIALILKCTHLPSSKYVCYNEVINFKNLTEQSQENVLERTVTFINSPNLQEINLKLHNFLTPSAARDFIDEVLLSEIITKTNNIQIGNSSAFYSDEYNVNYHIPRTLHNQILDKSILTHIDKHLFFITGISAENLISIFNVSNEFIHYWHEGKTFDVGIALIHEHHNTGVYNNDGIFKLIYDCCGKNTYWLDFRDNLILWKGVKINNTYDRVHTQVSKINKTISEKHTFEPIALKDKIVILANDAGEGKSTMLTDLAHALKEKFPERWIVRVDLKRFVNQTLSLNLNNIGFNDEDTSEAVEFVAQMAEQENIKINAKLERKIFEAALNGLSQIEVVLLFDGFDEISPGYKEQTCTLLKALAKSKVRQLWVATRIHLKEYLEEQLQAPAYMLTPFSKEQVIQYLNRFWKWKLKNYKIHSEIDTNENMIESALDCLKKGCHNYLYTCGSEVPSDILSMEDAVSDFKSKVFSFQIPTDFYKFIDEVIDLSTFAKLAYKKWSEVQGEDGFLNVPLNLKMFAENAFANKWCAHSFEDEHIFSIYKRFVNSKLQIYKQDKSTTLRGGPADKDQGDIASVVLRDMHREIAVKTLFDPSDSLPDINVCKKHKDLFEKLSRVGLTKFYGDRFEFTHRTFAEYFFIEYLALNLKVYDVQCEFLPKILIEKDFFMLRKLFNGFLSQCGWRSDNRAGSKYYLKNTLKSSVSEEIVSKSDEDGNSVLHIALLESHPFIFVFIVDNITIDDFISLNKNAISSVSMSILHLIMKYYRWAPLITVTIDLIKKDEALLKYVLTEKDSNGYTPVEYAIHCRHFVILNVFAKTAEDNVSDDIIFHMLPNIYSNWDTTLHNTAGWSINEIFEVILKLGIPFSLEKSESDSNKVTALHMAAYKGDVSSCSAIMSNYLNKDQIIIIHVAAENGHSQVCELIIKFSNKTLDVFEDLMKKCDCNENTAFLVAVLNEKNAVCDVIIKSVEDNFAILNYLLLKSDSIGRNVLHLATYLGYSKICGMIMKSAQNHPSILKVLLKSKDLDQ